MSVINILGIQRFQKLLSGGGGPQDKCQKMCRICKGKRDEEATHGERHKKSTGVCCGMPGDTCRGVLAMRSAVWS